jgi:creatinine amidohydrolase
MPCKASTGSGASQPVTWPGSIARMPPGWLIWPEAVAATVIVCPMPTRTSIPSRATVRSLTISASLSASTFETLVHEVAKGILGGCGKLLVLNTGISTLAPVDRALMRLASDRVRHLWIHEGPRYPRVARQLAEQSHGSHADELETSLMLALAPHLVDMKRAEASPVLKEEAPGALTPSDPTSPNYSRSGSYGDPTRATRAKGEALLAAMLDDLHEQAAAFIAQDPDEIRPMAVHGGMR